MQFIDCKFSHKYGMYWLKRSALCVKRKGGKKMVLTTWEALPEWARVKLGERKAGLARAGRVRCFPTCRIHLLADDDHPSYTVNHNVSHRVRQLQALVPEKFEKAVNRLLAS